MPPATITETTTRDLTEINCRQLEFSHKQQNANETPQKLRHKQQTANETPHKLRHKEKTASETPQKAHLSPHLSSYESYEATRPTNEPKFMKRIRDWEKELGFVTSLRWMNVIFISLFHLVAVIGFLGFMSLGNIPKWQTVLFGYLVGNIAGFGVTAGVHRYWCHRSYKASWPLQAILVLCYSTAGQNNIYNWVRDHRVHHKFSETSADPHDVRRGFFFAHVGWLMMRKHPMVLREGAKIDMSDIANDPLVQFHTRYFTMFKLLCCFVLPTLVPVYGWDESWTYAILSQALLRYMFSLNFTWAVNSFAHLWGNKPYDRHIKPAENWGVSVVAMGEGWHNYHHTFPWDYKAAELAYSVNVTTLVLDFFARIGWAYDMKTASPTLVRAVASNRGERKE